MKMSRRSCTSCRKSNTWGPLVPLPGSRQRGSVLAGCDAGHRPEHRCQMALVAQPDLLRDLGKGLIGPTDQSLRPVEPTLHDIALRTNADRLFEGATEMIGAETGYSGEIGQRQPIIQMGFDVVPHSLQALAGQPVRRFEQER